jgi:hypothetical protein
MSDLCSGDIGTALTHACRLAAILDDRAFASAPVDDRGLDARPVSSCLTRGAATRLNACSPLRSRRLDRGPSSWRHRGAWRARDRHPATTPACEHVAARRAVIDCVIDRVALLDLWLIGSLGSLRTGGRTARGSSCRTRVRAAGR